MPKATLILHRKRVFDDGSVSEMKLWLVPGPVRGSRHFFRHSLFYVGQVNASSATTMSLAKEIIGTMASTKSRTSSARQSSLSQTSSRMSARHDVGAAPEHRQDASVRMLIGGRIEDDAAAFVAAWHQAERGRRVSDRVLAFESWEALSAVMTGERHRLLRHVHRHPEPSVSALARALHRQYRRVHADVAALEEAGLLDRSTGVVRTTADRISADIEL